jgi:hypothetical protein
VSDTAPEFPDRLCRNRSDGVDQRGSGNLGVGSMRPGVLRKPSGEPATDHALAAAEGGSGAWTDELLNIEFAWLG